MVPCLKKYQGYPEEWGVCTGNFGFWSMAGNSASPIFPFMSRLDCIRCQGVLRGHAVGGSVFLYVTCLISPFYAGGGILFSYFSLGFVSWCKKIL